MSKSITRLRLHSINNTMKYFALISVCLFLIFSCSKKNAGVLVLAQVEKEQLLQDDVRILVPSWDALSDISKTLIIEKWVTQTLLKQSAEYHLLDRDPLFSLQLKQYSRQLLSDWALSRYIKDKAMVTKEEINDYYNHNQSEYKRGEAELNGLHVIVSKRSDAYKISRALKRHDQETIDLMLDTLDYEYDIFKLSSLIPSIRDVVKQNHSPSVFGPYIDSGIYHVFELKAWYPENSVIPLESVWDEIAARLAINKEKALRENLLDSLRNESKVIVMSSAY